MNASCEKRSPNFSTFLGRPLSYSPFLLAGLIALIYAPLSPLKISEDVAQSFGASFFDLPSFSGTSVVRFRSSAQTNGEKSVSTSGDDKTLLATTEEKKIWQKRERGEKMPRIEGSSRDVAADKPIFDQKIKLAVKKEQNIKGKDRTRIL